ncbi:MAG: NINE protein [Saprospiraceae bacterium]|jgi:TM2 domain-containing membrane protein YozV|nr:NINE protein [Saprospiraceae bacterium]
MKKKWVAIFLAIIGGSFGMHRFYLRQTEIGILYILLLILRNIFSIFGMPISTLLSWYDAYKFMIMDPNEFDRKYNSYYFRDRYGNRREMPKVQNQRRGRYILLDENQETTKRNQSSYFDLRKQRKESQNFKNSGIRKFKDYDIKGAIQDFKRAIDLDPNDKALHFNIACAYSMNEEAANAIIHLNKARLLGFNDWENVMKHESLAYIRVLPEFEAFRNNQFILTDSILERLNKRDRDLLEELQNARKVKTELLLDTKQNWKNELS